MKTHIRVYARVAEPEEPGPPVPSKDPTVLDVRDLSVPLGECVTVNLGPVDASTIKRLAENRFDHAPVQVPSAEFGWRLVARKELERLAAVGLPLTDDATLFLPNDTCDVGGFGYPGLLEVVKALATASAVLAYGLTYVTPVSPPGSQSREVEIYGLVTHSDLNKHPVRLAIYDCLARLELGLAHLVSAAFHDPWDWIQKVSQENQVRILGYMELSKRRDVEHEPVAGAMLPDLFNVIAKTPDLLSRLGLKNRGEFDNSTGRVADIRNRVMHPVRPLVLGEEDVRSIKDVVMTSEDLGERVGSALREISRRSTS